VKRKVANQMKASETDLLEYRIKSRNCDKMLNSDTMMMADKMACNKCHVCPG
jgi:hypothetical protein